MEFPIEQQPGETLDQAILRLASGLMEAKDKAILDTDSQSPTATKAKKITVTDPSAGENVDSDVHAAMHVYMRPNETEGQMRVMATRYRAMNGPNTLVFAHTHMFGEACTAACRERVAK
jgi:hypothetical protein